MRILVTGGAGYIGRVVTAQLLIAGHRVTVYDNLSHGVGSTVPRGADLMVADLSDRHSLAGVFRLQRPEAVVHLAAFIEADESMQRPELYFRNNTTNSLNLLEAMLEFGVRRLVFSSTAALYGNPAHNPIEETAALHPTNAYGESKLLVERILDWFFRIHGLRYASLRYFNAAGAVEDLGEDHHPESHLIPRILRVALGQSERVTIFGTDYPTADGTCIRDYVHVADLARAHLLALDALNQSDRLIYNIGNGCGFSVREVLEVARRVTGHPIPAEAGPRRAGDPAVLVASSQTIRRELGWTPAYPELEAIIESDWEWRKRYPDGYAEAAIPQLVSEGPVRAW